jgi:tetratricopeptide (TPR) repeat protein
MTPLKMKPWLTRLALAVGVPVALLGGLELALRIGGYGRPTCFLIPDEQPGYFRTNPDFTSQFLPAHFELRPLNFRVAAHKPANTVRIVVLGESAAQGIPVPSFAFAPQLRAQLRARYPGKEFEILNTGIVAINSHVIYQIARDLARFEPDVFLVYAGNNEVIGPYGPGCAYLSQMPPLWVIRASVFVRSTRTGQLIGRCLAHLASKGRRSEWGGMSMFVNNAVAGDDPRLDAVYANFRTNLRDIVELAHRAKAKTVLCTAVANLADCPPFLSQHRRGIADAERAQWITAFNAGRLAWKLGDLAQAKASLEAALRLDDHYADTHYLLGSIALASNEVGAAREHFAAALHRDELRFRPDRAINAVIREVAAAESAQGATLLDTAKILGNEVDSAAPPAGRQLLFEHVHFDWEGNFQLARLMASAIGAQIGSPAHSGGELDSAGCAAALAYTPHERWPMLLRIQVLVRKPPFTNLLTYCADEAQLAREIDAAMRAHHDPASLDHAAAIAQAALEHDPNNPALAGILEGVRVEQGNFSSALELARRARSLLPRDAALAADEASLLAKLGKPSEAEALLVRAARSDTDVADIAPVLLQLWSAQKRFDEGQRFLDAAIARSPADVRLRVGRATLLRSAGEVQRAEKEFRDVLTTDPSNAEALEGLIALLNAGGRSAEADAESLAHADVQPGNQENNFRAVKVAEAKSDNVATLRFMKAAERSGPVNSTFELNLALKVYQTGNTAEALAYLAEARKLTVIEGNTALEKSIDRLIAKLVAQAPSK